MAPLVWLASDSVNPDPSTAADGIGRFPSLTIAFFVFMFATGMRISDAIRVKASWITVDDAGWARIQIRRFTRPKV